VRQSHCVGGGALINFGWRGAPPVPTNRQRPKNIFKGSRKISFYPQNFLMTFSFLVIENCNKINEQQQWHRQRADKLSAHGSTCSANK